MTRSTLLEAAQPPATTAVGDPVRYQPALDGIRAVAVVAVLLYHGNVTWSRGGYLGVDVFFVLSGYLITMLLLVEWEHHGRIDLARFWSRRARRLFPALLLVVIFVGVYAAVSAAPTELARIRKDGLASIFYYENWRLIFSGQSYFDQFGAASPFRHAWSLAIEEQWYLIWPLLLSGLLLLARTRLVRVLAAVLGLAVASATLMVALYDPADISRVYYGTDTRVQALLVGAAVALVLQRRPVTNPRGARLLQWGAALGAAFLVWAIITVRDTSSFLYHGGLTLAAIASALVIAGVVQPSGSPLRRALSMRPLRMVGLISYGLYLWHWPIYVWLDEARSGLHGTALLVARLAVSFVAASVSYFAVELPIRRGRWLRGTFVRIVVPATALVVVGLFLATSSLVGTPEIPTAAARTSDPVELAKSARARVAELDRLAPPHTPRVLLFGDSTALTLGFGINPYDARHGLGFLSWAELGCGLARAPFVDDFGRLGTPSKACTDWPERWTAIVSIERPDVSVLMIGAWELYDREVGGSVREFGTPRVDAYMMSELERARAVLTHDGGHLALLTVPCFDTQSDVPGFHGSKRDQPTRVAHMNALFDRFARAHPDTVTLLDVRPFLCRGNDPIGERDGVALRPDGVHFTASSAPLMWEYLAPRLAAIAREHPGPSAGR